MVKNPPANVGDTGSILGWRRFCGVGNDNGIVNGNPLQYSCLEHSMDGGVWQFMGWQTVRHD